MRNCRDRMITGKDLIEAEVVACFGGNIYLRLKNKTLIEVPVDFLMHDDRIIVEAGVKAGRRIPE